MQPPSSDEEVQMMKSPQQWPMYPFLPVKRRSGKRGVWPELGTMVSGNGPVVVAASIDDLMKDPALVRNGKLYTFKSYEEIVSAGWVVD